MLRFNEKAIKEREGDGNFNTSYVTVQPFVFPSSNSGSLNFNTSYVTVQLAHAQLIHLLFEFQYILCYGSTITKRST